MRWGDFFVLVFLHSARFFWFVFFPCSVSTTLKVVFDDIEDIALCGTSLSSPSVTARTL